MGKSRASQISSSSDSSLWLIAGIAAGPTAAGPVIALVLAHHPVPVIAMVLAHQPRQKIVAALVLVHRSLGKRH